MIGVVGGGVLRAGFMLRWGWIWVGMGRRRLRWR